MGFTHVYAYNEFSRVYRDVVYKLEDALTSQLRIALGIAKDILSDYDITSIIFLTFLFF